MATPSNITAYDPDDFTGVDDHAKWEAMQDQIDSDLDPNDDGGNYDRLGVEIIVRRGYSFDDDLTIRRANLIRGEGSGNALYTKGRLKFDSGTRLVVPGYDGRADGTGIGQGTRFRDLLIEGDSVSPMTALVKAKGVIVMENCIVSNGSVNIEANTVNSENACSSGMFQCWIINAPDGIYALEISGNNGNACNFWGVHISSSEYGIKDTASIMNTYVGCSVHATKKAYYIDGGANATKVLISCYQEEGQTEDNVLTRGPVFGGNVASDPNSAMPWIAGPGTYEGQHFFNNSNADNEIATWLGAASGTDVAQTLDAKAPDNTSPTPVTRNTRMEWHFDDKRMIWQFRQMSQSKAAFGVTGPFSTQYHGSLFYPDGTKLPKNHIFLQQLMMGTTLYPMAVAWYTGKASGTIVQGDLPTTRQDGSQLVDGDMCINLRARGGDPAFFIWADDSGTSKWFGMGTVDGTPIGD